MGYTGSDDELAERARGLRRAAEVWDVEDIREFIGLSQGGKDAFLKAALDIIDNGEVRTTPTTPKSTPAPTPTPTPSVPTPGLGLQSNGDFNVTDAQLRDPAFCFAHREHATRFTIVEGDPSAPKGQMTHLGWIPDSPEVGQSMASKLRDPDWCFSDEGRAYLSHQSKLAMNKPIASVNELAEVM